MSLLAGGIHKKLNIQHYRIVCNGFLQRRYIHVDWEDNVAHSKLKPIDLPPYNHNFTEFMMKNFNNYGEKLAIMDGVTNQTRTFNDLTNDTNSVAFSLQERGIQKGDTIALMSPNHVDFFSAFHGPSLLGANVTPINPSYTKYEVEKQLTGSSAKLAIVHEDCMESVSGALKMMGKENFPILTLADVPDAKVTDSFEEARTIGKTMDIPKIQSDFPGDQLVALPYSSGTTGLPKGTMLSHDNLISNVLQMDDIEMKYFKPTDVILSPLPLFHIYAFTCSLHGPLLSGNTLVTMKRFDLLRFCELVQEMKVTHAHIVPPIILALTKSPEVSNYDLSSLRVIMSAAAPLGAEQEQELSNMLGGAIVKQAWGMSELSPIGTYHADEHVKPGSGSCGVPVANTSVKVIDLETGEALPPNTEGELVIRGPQVMKGYLNDPEKTAECLDDYGWLKTGDIAKIDDHGYVYIMDRLKDLIKYKGFQIAPAELESVICTHPSVKDSTVIPVEDDEAGEVPRAYVVLKPGHEKTTTNELVEFVAERVAPHKRLRGGIRFTDEIPKNASGKILRRKVIEMDRST